jgi:hypothetical protein
MDGPFIADFNHLLQQFPNNRYATRYFSKFLTEIRAFYDESRQWAEKSLRLMHGHSISTDEAHELGLHAFHSLFHVRLPNSEVVKPRVFSKDFTHQFLGEDEMESIVESESVSNNILF